MKMHTNIIIHENVSSVISNHLDTAMAEFTTHSSVTATFVESLFGSPPVFILDTETTPFLGGEYAVFAVEVEQANLRLCVRLPRMIAGPHASQLLSREISLRQRIESANIRPFQKLIAFDTSLGNVLQSPYMILEWANGTPLRWSDSSPQGDHRKRVLRDVANASLDLLKISNASMSVTLQDRSQILPS